MANLLDRAGLPAPPETWLGRAFRFVAEHGSHHQILVGTITGIYASDEGSLELHVSIPRFWGKPLKYLAHTSNGWVAVIRDLEAMRDVRLRYASGRIKDEDLDLELHRAQCFPGKFELI